MTLPTPATGDNVTDADHPPVPFVDLSRQHAPLLDQIDAAVTAIFRRGDFILGAAVDDFEDSYATYIGVEHAIGVASGTAALAILLRAAGIGPGDEVIVPAHTFTASALGIVHAGATPVFCDVDDETGLVDLDSAASVVGPNTAALMVVHLYGQVCDMEAAAAFTSERGLALFEDAAQAHGASWDDGLAGSFGRGGAFSFYPSKNLGAFGDGGMITTDDDELAGLAKRWRNLGQREKGIHLDLGYNERLDTVQAAILACKLPHLDDWNNSRRQVAGWYRDRLPAGARTLPVRERAADIHHLFPVRVRDRDAVAVALAEAGIGAGIHYSPAVHAQPVFAEAGAEPRTDLSVSEAWAREEISLPMFPFMNEAEVDATCAALERAIEGAQGSP